MPRLVRSIKRDAASRGAYRATIRRPPKLPKALTRKRLIINSTPELLKMSDINNPVKLKRRKMLSQLRSKSELEILESLFEENRSRFSTYSIAYSMKHTTGVSKSTQDTAFVSVVPPHLLIRREENRRHWSIIHDCPQYRCIVDMLVGIAPGHLTALNSPIEKDVLVANWYESVRALRDSGFVKVATRGSAQVEAERLQPVHPVSQLYPRSPKILQSEGRSWALAFRKKFQISRGRASWISLLDICKDVIYRFNGWITELFIRYTSAQRGTPARCHATTSDPTKTRTSNYPGEPDPRLVRLLYDVEQTPEQPREPSSVRAAVVFDLERGGDDHLKYGRGFREYALIDYYTGETLLRRNFLDEDKSQVDLNSFRQFIRKRLRAMNFEDTLANIEIYGQMYRRWEARNNIFRFVSRETTVLTFAGKPDMIYLGWRHDRICDVWELQLRYSGVTIPLKDLTWDFSKIVIQSGGSHDAVEDCLATRELVNIYCAGVLQLLQQISTADESVQESLQALSECRLYNPLLEASYTHFPLNKSLDLTINRRAGKEKQVLAGIARSHRSSIIRTQSNVYGTQSEVRCHMSRRSSLQEHRSRKQGMLRNHRTKQKPTKIIIPRLHHRVRSDIKKYVQDAISSENVVCDLHPPFHASGLVQTSRNGKSLNIVLKPILLYYLEQSMLPFDCSYKMLTQKFAYKQYILDFNGPKTSTFGPRLSHVLIQLLWAWRLQGYQYFFRRGSADRLWFDDGATIHEFTLGEIDFLNGVPPHLIPKHQSSEESDLNCTSILSHGNISSDHFEDADAASIESSLHIGLIDLPRLCFKQDPHPDIPVRSIKVLPWTDLIMERQKVFLPSHVGLSSSCIRLSPSRTLDISESEPVITYIIEGRLEAQDLNLIREYMRKFVALDNSVATLSGGLYKLVNIMVRNINKPKGKKRQLLSIIVYYIKQNGLAVTPADGDLLSHRAFIKHQKNFLKLVLDAKIGQKTSHLLMILIWVWKLQGFEYAIGTKHKNKVVYNDGHDTHVFDVDRIDFLNGMPPHMVSEDMSIAMSNMDSIVGEDVPVDSTQETYVKLETENENYSPSKIEGPGHLTDSEATQIRNLKKREGEALKRTTKRAEALKEALVHNIPIHEITKVPSSRVSEQAENHEASIAIESAFEKVTSQVAADAPLDANMLTDQRVEDLNEYSDTTSMVSLSQFCDSLLACDRRYIQRFIQETINPSGPVTTNIVGLNSIKLIRKRFSNTLLKPQKIVSPLAFYYIKHNKIRLSCSERDIQRCVTSLANSRLLFHSSIENLDLNERYTYLLVQLLSTWSLQGFDYSISHQGRNKLVFQEHCFDVNEVDFVRGVPPHIRSFNRRVIYTNDIFEKAPTVVQNNLPEVERLTHEKDRSQTAPLVSPPNISLRTKFPGCEGQVDYKQDTRALVNQQNVEMIEDAKQAGVVDIMQENLENDSYNDDERISWYLNRNDDPELQEVSATKDGLDHARDIEGTDASLNQDIQCSIPKIIIPPFIAPSPRQILIYMPTVRVSKPATRLRGIYQHFLSDKVNVGAHEDTLITGTLSFCLDRRARSPITGRVSQRMPSQSTPMDSRLGWFCFAYRNEYLHSTSWFYDRRLLQFAIQPPLPHEYPMTVACESQELNQQMASHDKLSESSMPNTSKSSLATKSTSSDQQGINRVEAEKTQVCKITWDDRSSDEIAQAAKLHLDDVNIESGHQLAVRHIQSGKSDEIKLQTKRLTNEGSNGSRSEALIAKLDENDWPWSRTLSTFCKMEHDMINDMGNDDESHQAQLQKHAQINLQAERNQEWKVPLKEHGKKGMDRIVTKLDKGQVAETSSAEVEVASDQGDLLRAKSHLSNTLDDFSAKVMPKPESEDEKDSHVGEHMTSKGVEDSGNYKLVRRVLSEKGKQVKTKVQVVKEKTS